MNHLSLFSGIGGLDLASEMAGFETVGQCEWADYPRSILEKHWPGLPRWRDIRELTKEDFYAKTGMGKVDIISGGFPCQPFSVAGKQKGREDDRYLWPEMLRVVRELAPRWVVGENVPGILRIAAEDVVKDLEREGYRVCIFDFEAAAVGAWHRRERIFFVANRDMHGQPSAKEPGRADQGNGREARTENAEQPERLRAAGEHENVADAQSRYLRDDGNHQRQAIGEKHEPGDTGVSGRKAIYNGMRSGCERQYRGGELSLPENGCWWSAESGMGGMVDGIPNWLDGEPAGIPRIVRGVKHRADRIKALGNAVVPAQAYPIFRAIAMIEKEVAG